MGLTTTGIAYQIVSSLKTYKIEHKGTENDCKVVINHLIRKFSEPLEKNKLQRYYYSKLLNKNSKTIKEHLLPVNEIMNYFLKIVDISKDNNILADEVIKYLKNALVIVYITKEEDDILNKNGLQRKMPKEFFCLKHELYNDMWARYKISGIFENIKE